MNPAEEYRQFGATWVRGLFPREVVDALTYQLSRRVAATGTQMLAPPSIGNKPCYEAYCYHLPVLLTFLWGLTPRMQDITGKRLLPSYSYFRTYQKGDRCRIHCDRPSCEHSISLTLGYADDIDWALELGRDRVAPEQRGTELGEDHFPEDRHVKFAMQPGDAVFYQGIDFMHGRTQANPNRWSAHLFLHWVDRDGPFAEHAFDRQKVSGATDFQFPENR
ncbi:MAG: hypothetical protein RQ741_12145 [Wenzhouxiangellaceae bacterium]|nr:hypothetical protein [Wenzhouxiangellaceae bacterium]